MTSKTAIDLSKLAVQSDGMNDLAAKCDFSSYTAITHYDVPNRNIISKTTYNTYQLEPDVKFPRGVVAKIIKEVVDSLLVGREYEPNFCRHTTKLITDTLKNRVKSLQLRRYRIITQAILSGAADPKFYSTSLCLWESTSDTCVSYQFRNDTIAAVVSVFGIYQS